MPLYACLHNRHTTPSSHQVTDPRVWSREASLRVWRLYLGNGDSENVSPYAAPSRAADLSDLPPADMMSGQLDIIRDENMEYARRLMQAGVPTELHIYPGAFHVFEFIAPTAAISQRVAGRGEGRGGWAWGAAHPIPQPRRQEVRGGGLGGGGEDHPIPPNRGPGGGGGRVIAAGQGGGGHPNEGREVGQHDPQPGGGAGGGSGPIHGGPAPGGWAREVQSRLAQRDIIAGGIPAPGRNLEPLRGAGQGLPGGDREAGQGEDRSPGGRAGGGAEPVHDLQERPLLIGGRQLPGLGQEGQRQEQNQGGCWSARATPASRAAVARGTRGGRVSRRPKPWAVP